MSLDESSVGLSGAFTDEAKQVFSGTAQADVTLKPVPDITEDISLLALNFRRVREGMNAQELRDFHAQLETHIESLKIMQVGTQEELINFNLLQSDEWLKSIDNAARYINDMPPGLGERFIRMRNDVAANRVINTGIGGQGSFSAFQLGGTGPTRINEIQLNTMKDGVDNDANFFGTDIHENIHAINLKQTKIMELTPWNNDTTVVLHPLAWMRAERISESLA